MSETPPPQRLSESPDGGGARTPRGSRLRDRVTFFEQVWSGNGNDQVDQARPSSRQSNSSYEESYEKLVEEGIPNGSRIVKFEKITMHKSVREVVSSVSTSSATRNLTEAASVSRASSEERNLDSAYQSHEVHSKSSSVTSFTRSDESICQQQQQQLRRVTQSPTQLVKDDERSPAEWYADYRNQSFQNVAAKMDYVRSRSEYDAHIAEIRGNDYRLGPARC